MRCFSIHQQAYTLPTCRCTQNHVNTNITPLMMARKHSTMVPGLFDKKPIFIMDNECVMPGIDVIQHLFKKPSG